AGRVRAVRRPDDTVTVYSYEFLGDGSLQVTREEGAPSAPAPFDLLSVTVVDGMRTVQVFDEFGNEQESTRIDIASGLEISSRLVIQSDAFGRPLEVSYPLMNRT